MCLHEGLRDVTAAKLSEGILGPLLHLRHSAGLGTTIRSFAHGASGEVMDQSAHGLDTLLLRLGVLDGVDDGRANDRAIGAILLQIQHMLALRHAEAYSHRHICVLADTRQEGRQVGCQARSRPCHARHRHGVDPRGGGLGELFNALVC